LDKLGVKPSKYTRDIILSVDGKERGRVGVWAMPDPKSIAPLDPG
jgi:hypothetical protein